MLHSLSSDLVLFLKHSTPFERLAVVSETPKFLSSGLLLKFLQTSKPFEWFAPLLWHTEALFERVAPVSRIRWSLSSRLLKHSSPRPSTQVKNNDDIAGPGAKRTHQPAATSCTPPGRLVSPAMLPSLCTWRGLGKGSGSQAFKS